MTLVDQALAHVPLRVHSPIHLRYPTVQLDTRLSIDNRVAMLDNLQRS